MDVLWEQVLTILQQYNMYFKIAVGLIALLSFLLAVTALIKTRTLKKRYDFFMGTSRRPEHNLEEMLLEYSENVREVKEAYDKVLRVVDEIYKSMEGCTQRVGVIRYNPFDEMGGNLCFAVAILDGHNNGVVLNGIHSRTGSFTYAKPVEAGVSTYVLSNEEMQAIEKAKENAVPPADRTIFTERKVKVYKLKANKERLLRQLEERYQRQQSAFQEYEEYFAEMEERQTKAFEEMYASVIKMEREFEFQQEQLYKKILQRQKERDRRFTKNIFEKAQKWQEDLETEKEDAMSVKKSGFEGENEEGKKDKIKSEQRKEISEENEEAETEEWEDEEELKEERAEKAEEEENEIGIEELAEQEGQSEEPEVEIEGGADKEKLAVEELEEEAAEENKAETEELADKEKLAENELEENEAGIEGIEEEEKELEEEKVDNEEFNKGEVEQEQEQTEEYGVQMRTLIDETEINEGTDKWNLEEKNLEKTEIESKFEKKKEIEEKEKIEKWTNGGEITLQAEKEKLEVRVYKREKIESQKPVISTQGSSRRTAQGKRDSRHIRGVKVHRGMEKRVPTTSIASRLENMDSGERNLKKEEHWKDEVSGEEKRNENIKEEELKNIVKNLIRK